MRKSSKEHKEQLARREKALQAEAATMTKEPPGETFSKECRLLQIRACYGIQNRRAEYCFACEAVKEEDKRLQDLLRAMEFSETRAETDKITTKLVRSRKFRRQSKDDVKRHQLIVEFFNDQNNKATLNKMGQLLGRQRKEEESLNGDRVYKPRTSN